MTRFKITLTCEVESQYLAEATDELETTAQGYGELIEIKSEEAETK